MCYYARISVFPAYPRTCFFAVSARVPRYTPSIIDRGDDGGEEREELSALSIIGTGRYLPGRPIPNENLARVMDTSDEWIRKRTGIHQRHFAENGQGVGELGARAAERAIEDAGIDPTEIDFILFATMTPDHLFPGSGPLVAERLGISGVPALDIRQQCASFPFALEVANGLIASGAARTILFVAADTHASLMPFRDWDVVRGNVSRTIPREDFERATAHRGIAVIFGDGASAVIFRATDREGAGLLRSELRSDGGRADHIFIPMGFSRLPFNDPELAASDAHLPQMKGGNLLKAAVRELSELARAVMEQEGIGPEEVDLFIAHQANQRINDAVAAALKLSPERIPSNIARYGNTSSATIGILLDELRHEGRIQEGDLLCFLALGAGLHAGASLFRY